MKKNCIHEEAFPLFDNAATAPANGASEDCSSLLATKSIKMFMLSKAFAEITKFLPDSWN